MQFTDLFWCTYIFFAGISILLHTNAAGTCALTDVHLELSNGTQVANHGFLYRGELRDNPLLCVTPDNITCCSTTETGGAPLGNWYFPNGTEVPTNDTGWLFYTTRGPGVVQLHRRTGGVSGIYRCVIPDQSGVNQTLNVGLYAITSATSGKKSKIYALYMSDRKHYLCFVPMSYLWF